MRTADSNRRAFLRSLKPRIVEIQQRAAERAGFKVSMEELDADVAAARAEYRAHQAKRNAPYGLLRSADPAVVDGIRHALQRDDLTPDERDALKVVLGEIEELEEHDPRAHRRY